MPTRCRDRAAAWQTDMHRAAQYWYARATTPDEIAEVDTVLNATLADGPDFARHHRDSTFRTPPQVCTDRNFMARLMLIARTIERKTWESRKKGAHGGALGKSGLRLLETLLYAVSKREGCLYPSLVTLARLAQVSKPTVIAALKALVQMGLLTVYRRIKRVRTAFGIRVVQDSNAYEYHEPHGLGALAWAIFRPSSESKNMTARETFLLSGAEEDAERSASGLARQETARSRLVRSPIAV
jgi:DNA-binding MarR family transcriptional regulator